MEILEGRKIIGFFCLFGYINSQLIAATQNRQNPINSSDVLATAASSYSGSMQPQGPMRGPNVGYNSYQMLGGSNSYGMNYDSPSYDTKPQSYGFDCYGKPPGLYGNANYDCRMFHVCQADGRQDTLRCPPTTKFNNYLGVCDWESKIDNNCMPLYREESYASSQNQNYAQLGNQYPSQQANSYGPRSQLNSQYSKMY